jgi:Tol biopolymer transport system component
MRNTVPLIGRRLLGAGVALWAVCAGPAFAAFPGHNGEIAVEASPAPGRLDIGAIALDGTARTIVGMGTRDESSPAWSPDGERLAFARYEGGPDSNLFIVNSDGSGEHRLTTSGGMDESPSWSPDGRRIVYTADPTTNCVRDPDCEAEVHILNVDTLDDFVLADRGYQPAWSPRGDVIAFTRTAPCAGCHEDDIYTVAPDGSGLTNLTADTSDDAVQATWSPDGAQIAYAANFDCCVPHDIAKMNADGSNKTRLTFSGSPAPFIIADGPTWSPDGKRIAFIWRPVGTCSSYGCGWELFHMATDGTDITRVTNDGQRQARPDWGAAPRHPPDCSNLAPSRQTLWPHNRRFVKVWVSGAADPDGEPLTVQITGVTQDEPVTGRRDWTTPDAKLPGGAKVRLRAERNPKGDGRVYRVAVRVSDSDGASCDGTVQVEVRRHKHKPAVDSAPPSYDSVAVAP